MRKLARSGLLFLIIPFLITIPFIMANEGHDELGMRFVHIAAKDKFERTELLNMGVSIEHIRSDSVWGFADPVAMETIRNAGVKILGEFDPAIARGGHGQLDFPSEDSRFHNYAEAESALRMIANENSDIARVVSIGQSLEGRELFAIHFNSTPEALMQGQSTKPGLIITGAHHAREHISTEIPLMFAQHLAANRSNEEIARLLDSRDIWIIPMVNPDGVEWDISTGSYKSWRKNRRSNHDGTKGVDLNRNYSFKWNTGGSSNSPSSDVYMGPEPFSEPETQAIKAFVEAHDNLRLFVSFHSFSELILYPWGHKYDPIEDDRDRRVLETAARTMAQWNGYTPQQSSDLYIASGVTQDWAYGDQGLFAFTFELSPKSWWNGGFYPGAGVIDRVFNDNLKPLLYLVDMIDDPYKVIDGEPTGFLKNYVEPKVSNEDFWNRHPY